MIPFLVTAALGALFVTACVRWRRFIFRSLLVALCVTAGLGLWLALGRHNLYVAWAPFACLPVVAAYLLRHRLARRFPVLTRLHRSRRPTLRETLIDEPTWWGDDE